MIAALSERKGQHFVIPAFAKARQNCTCKLALVLVGKTEAGLEAFEIRLQELVTTLNLEGQVHFLGYRRDIPQLLAAFDIFIHPSNFDPFPLAVLETSSAGLPVVA